MATPLREEERLTLYETPEEPSNPGVGLKPIPATSAEWTYAALVRQEADGDFGVRFPDLPGCVAAGSTFEEAGEMAREVLALHLEGNAAGGEYVPSPSSADAVLAHPDAMDAIALIVVEALPERLRETAPEWEQDAAATPAN